MRDPEDDEDEVSLDDDTPAPFVRGEEWEPYAPNPHGRWADFVYDPLSKRGFE